LLLFVSFFSPYHLGKVAQVFTLIIKSDVLKTEETITFDKPKHCHVLIIIFEISGTGFDLF
jgi:hypothetical protein